MSDPMTDDNDELGQDSPLPFPVPTAPIPPEAEAVLDEEGRLRLAQALAALESASKPLSPKTLKDKRVKRTYEFINDLVHLAKDHKRDAEQLADPKFMLEGQRIGRETVIRQRIEIDQIRQALERANARAMIARIESFEMGRNAAGQLAEIAASQCAPGEEMLRNVLLLLAKRARSLMPPWVPRGKPNEETPKETTHVDG